MTAKCVEEISSPNKWTTITTTTVAAAAVAAVAYAVHLDKHKRSQHIDSK